jgi:hypothetical protein
METAQPTSNGNTPTPVALRPMGLGEILDLAITLYRRNFITLAGISAVVSIPVLILQVIAALFALPTDPFAASSQVSTLFNNSMAMFFFVGGFMLVGILSAIAEIYEAGAMAAAVSSSYLGRVITIRQAYGQSLRRWFPLFISTLFLGLVNLVCLSPFIAIFSLSMAASIMNTTSSTSSAVAGLSILCLCIISIPLLFLWTWLTTRLTFFTQSIVLENWGARSGLGRSWRLVKNSFWRVWGTMLLLGIFIYILTMVPTFAVQFGTSAFLPGSIALSTMFNSAISTIVAILITPIQFAVMTMLYYDLRIRKEGFDLQFAMQQADSSTSAGSV